MNPRIAVTGIGMVTALGFGATANWAALIAGRSGIRRITRFEVTGMRATMAGCVDLPGDRPGMPLSVAVRAQTLGEAAIAEALAQAALTSPFFDGPLCIGMPPVELEWPERSRFGAETYAALIEAATGQTDAPR